MHFDLARALETAGGKAIGAHPALQGGAPVSVYQPGASRQDAKLSQREAVKHLEAYGGDQAIDHVMNAVDFYASTVGDAQWRLQKPDGTRLVETKTEHDAKGVEVGPADLYELLKRPNPFMLYDELVQLLIIDLLLVGNGYWYKWRNNAEGKPLALYRLAPPYVKIIPGQFGPKRYEYQVPGMREPLKIALKDMVHMKLPNPHDAYYGMGLIRKGGRLLDLELEVTETMASHYANRADPSLVVQSERRVPRDVFNKLRAQLRARVSGAPRSGELLVLEAGLKAETLGKNDKASMFDVISKLSRDRIYAMFRINPVLFGYSGTGGAGTDPTAAARREFDTYVMRPFLDKLQQRVTEYVVAAWDLEFKIDYNYVIPQDELLKNISTVAAIPGIKVRELRRALMPLGFLDGESTGDSEIDDEILNMPMPEMDANGQGGAPNRNLAGQPGRPPTGSNVSTFSRPAGGKTRVTPATRKPAKKAVESPQEAVARVNALLEAKAVTLEPEQATVSIGRQLANEQRPQDRQSAERARAVNDTAAFITAGVADATTALERALLDHVEGKAFKRSDAVSRIRKSEAWVAFREKLEEVFNDAGRRAISSAVMDMAAHGVTSDDDLDYDAIARSVIHRKGGLTGIVNTTKKRIAAKLANLSADATKQDADAVIQAEISDFKAGQAEVIGVTEAVHLYNEGTLAVAEAAGLTEVYVTDGEDDDQPCKDAHGSVWDIDTARERRLEHPNCRRAFLPLTEVA